MLEIKDSGNRRQFSSGAVRDIAEGKGRMDLMPLDIISNLYAYINNEKSHGRVTSEFSSELGVKALSDFCNTGHEIAIYDALWSFMFTFYNGSVESALLDTSIHYEDGARKYGEYNWQKGIPCHCYVDSALRHCMKFLRGDEDEHHDRAFIWNLLGLLWTVYNKPEFNDLPYTLKDQKQADKSTEQNSERSKRRKEIRDLLAKEFTEDEIQYFEHDLDAVDSFLKAAFDDIKERTGFEIKID